MNKKYRRALIAGNWKMNMLPSDVREYMDVLRPGISRKKSCDIAICAPYVVMPALLKACRDTRIAVGAQNVSEYDKGAYTGEVSSSMLRDLGAKYVIIGHSERRQYFGETDETVNTKTIRVLEHEMIPIICVGETKQQREWGLTETHVTYQVLSAIHDLSEKDVRRCVIAYEPIWAIGTGVTATATDAQAVCAHIRTILRKNYGARTARTVTILYGGSMNSSNALELLYQPDIDGGLIGGASLSPRDFASIIATTGMVVTAQTPEPGDEEASEKPADDEAAQVEAAQE